MLTAVCFALEMQPALGDPPVYNFDTVRQSLAIVETDSGVGSGFIVFIDGNKYLLTNCHVVKDAKQLAFKLIDGKELVPLSVDIADEHDLVRFRLKDDTDIQALSLASVPPTINKSILVLGNSDGRGVATQIEGKILGLGPGVVEVDAGFVSGNSGSPIITLSGEVLGVATYVTRAPPHKNWITQGTRFEATRRFGIRVSDGMKWNRISWRQLIEQTALLDEVNEYANDLIVILACWRNYGFVDDPKNAFRQYALGMQNQNPSVLRRQMNSFIRQYALYLRDVKKYADRSFTLSSIKDALAKDFRAVPSVARQRLRKEVWVSSDFAKQAKDIDELLALLSDETEKVLQSSSFWIIGQWNNGMLYNPDFDIILR